MFIDLSELHILDMLSELFAVGKISLKNGDILNILGMVGIALLTVMIPVAVAVFSDKSEKKEEDRDDYEILDRSTILEHVVKAKYLLPYMALIYTPILLWGFFPHWIFYAIFLISWGFGVRGMVSILINAYHWMKGDKDKLRKEYLGTLNTLNKLEDTPKLWRSVWEIDGRHDYHEKEFFIIFSVAIDKLLKGDSNSIRIASELMQDFNKHINKRPAVFLVAFDEVFPKILEWDFVAWGKKQETNSGDIRLYYYELSEKLSSIFKEVEERALKKGLFLQFSNFLEPHVENNKERFIKKKLGQRYIDKLIGDFFYVFVGNIEERDNSWGFFPDQWKITQQHIHNKDNHVSMVLFNCFWHWANRRLVNAVEYDKILRDVICYLFPKACPVMWMEILAFLTRPYVSGKRMKSMIECPLEFERMYRDSPAFWGDEPEKEQIGQDVEEKETINIALFRFGGGLTEEFLNEHIAELEAMSGNYSDSSSEEIRRKRYIDIFQRIKARRKEIIKEANQ